jgi:hypothetical protein
LLAVSVRTLVVSLVGGSKEAATPSGRSATERAAGDVAPFTFTVRVTE